MTENEKLVAWLEASPKYNDDRCCDIGFVSVLLQDADDGDLRSQYTMEGLMLDALAADGRAPVLSKIINGQWECQGDSRGRVGFHGTHYQAIRACCLSWLAAKSPNPPKGG